MSSFLTPQKIVLHVYRKRILHLLSSTDTTSPIVTAANSVMEKICATCLKTNISDQDMVDIIHHIDDLETLLGRPLPLITIDSVDDEDMRSKNNY